MPAVSTSNGKIELLYMDSEQCYIRLKDQAVAPLDGYFRLKKSHSSFDAIYSLLLTALANNLMVHIRPHEEVNPGEYGIVVHVIVSG